MVGMRDIDASFLQHERMCDGESALPGAKPRHLSDTHKGIAISTGPGVLASAVRVLRIPCMVCRGAVGCGTCFGQHPTGVVDVQRLVVERELNNRLRGFDSTEVDTRRSGRPSFEDGDREEVGARERVG